MPELQALASNRALLCTLLSWLVAQLLKAPTWYFITREWSWRRLLGSGGMPSSHTAMVFSLALSVGILEGFDSAVFTGCFVLMVVVIYDAMGVRRETGRQGTVINKILRGVLIEGNPISKDVFKELVGHSPSEVVGGIFIGLVVTLLFINA